MPYNAVVDRTDSAGLIPIEYSMEMANAIASEGSYVMRLGRRLRNMSRYQATMPVMSALATAYFVNGDTGLVQTTEVSWEDVIVTAEPIAAIVPVPKDVLNDQAIPIWNEVRTELVTACGVAIDQAMLYGTNKPGTWPSAIVTAAAAASHSVSLATKDDLYQALLDEGGVFSLVEEDGFQVNGAIAHTTMKGKLRGCRTTDGQPIFNPNPAMAGEYTLDGQPTYFPKTGVTSSLYPLIAGDWQQLAYAIREDMNFEVATQGVITDASGNVIYNLFQQRMAAIMVTMRLGFALPNPINRVNQVAATRYPFAYLAP